MSDAPLPPPRPRGRGAGLNPEVRFAELHVAYEPGEAPARVETKFYTDHSRSILAKNESPDLGFAASINPYRGCEHGYAYCYARPTHEYLGWSAGLDFESRIMVKTDAARLLREALLKRSYRPAPLSLSGVTDCYQPVERRLRVTRACLEVLAEFRHPVYVVTKNHLITRDTDLLAELARHRAVAVHVSLNSLDAKLAQVLEPRASSPHMRLEAIRHLQAAGVPVGVIVAPVIPAINDHEMPAVLAAAAAAGAGFATYTVVRLPFSVKQVFTEWLEQHFPARKDKVLGRIRELQGETLSHGEFGTRFSGQGVWAEQVAQMFRVARERTGLARRPSPVVTAEAFRRPAQDGQMELFGD